MSDGQPMFGSLYVYAPNQAAPIFFTVAFALSAVSHIWQCTLYKSFAIIGLHPVCAVLFTVGFAMREYGSFNYMYSKPNLNVFIVSQVAIYVCPPLLELANYHVLGRVFYYVPHLAPLPPGRVLAAFGGVMMVVEVLNALGVALVANPTSTNGSQATGSQLTIASIVIQIVLIITFLILAGTFHRRLSRANIRSRAASTPLMTLYASMTLILVRSIYRLIEHTQNATVHLSDLEALKALSPLLRFEWYFYVFEATVMLLNSVLWNVFSPGRFLPRDHSVHLSQDGRTEVQGEKASKKKTSIPLMILAVLTFGLSNHFLHEKKDSSFMELADQRRSSTDGREVLIAQDTPV